MNKRVRLIGVGAVLITLLVESGVSGVVGQSDPKAIVDLALYEGNPILTAGADGEWDAGGVFAPHVIYHDGAFHMFYTGRDGALNPVGLAIGYATSEDGLNWTRHEDNPVLVLDESFGRYGPMVGSVAVDGDTWIMWFSLNFASTSTSAPPSLGKIILRATAPAPTGPWTIDAQPALEAGTGADWDSLGIGGGSVVSTGDGFIVTYGVQNLEHYGLATSPDGITWVKYNDPATTTGQFANSDPVFSTENPELFLGPQVIAQRADGGWEMFYAGGYNEGGRAWTTLSYATSPDGIHWMHFPANPVLEIPNVTHRHPVPNSVVVVDDTYYLYYSEYFDWRIGVAIGTVTWE